MKKLIYELLYANGRLSKKALFTQMGLAVVILASSLLSIWETIPENNKEDFKLFDICHYAFGFIFVVEYFLRMWVAPLQFPYEKAFKTRVKTFFRPAMLIDLLVIFPFVLPAFINIDMSMLRILRLMRIMTIARFGRFSQSTKAIIRLLKKSAPELTVSLVFSFILLVIAATGIYHLEKEVQPENFPSIPHSIWWAVNALTGIWLGDIYPITVWGKIFASFISFIGVGTVALPAGILASGIMDAVNESKSTESSSPVCPHCLELKNKVA